jgi:hypothetical protein
MKDFPRVTEEHIEAKIVKSEYIILPDLITTICQLTLQNGFTVTGESACVSPENFDIDIGRHTAYKKAFNKIWELEGYLLKEKLYLESQKEQDFDLS